MTDRPPMIGSVAEHAREVQFLVVGEKHPGDRLVYPVNPEVRHPRPWSDAPKRALGPHDGRPDSL